MNPGRAAKLNPHIVKDYFDKLKAVMEEYELFDKPHCIFNMDEKGCRLTLHHQQQVMAQRGAKRVHLVAQNMQKMCLWLYVQMQLVLPFPLW